MSIAVKKKKKELIKKRKYKTIFDRQLTKISPEIKSVDIPETVTNFNTPATTTAQLINALEEGTGFWNRIGGIVSNQSLYIRGYIDAVQTSPGIPGLLRMIVFYDRQANGALPAFNDVIRGVTNTGLNTNDGLTGINPINRERFLILYDKYMYGVGYLGTGTPTLMEGVNTQGKDGNNEFIIECYIPLRNLVTSYINELPTTPPTIAGIKTGSIGIFFVDSNSTNRRRAVWSARLTFTDK